MKKCITCKLEKLNNEFYSNNNECKLCKNKRSKKHYLDNKNEYENYTSNICRQPELISKFMKSILIPNDKNECWLWIKSKARKGYGQFYIGSKALRSHRVSYLIFKGDIDKGLYVCHSCDNPSCVNPDHLWLGSNQDNVDDRERKGRNKSPFIKGNKYAQKIK